MQVIVQDNALIFGAQGKALAELFKFSTVQVMIVDDNIVFTQPNTLDEEAGDEEDDENTEEDEQPKKTVRKKAVRKKTSAK